jgi:hypothetical protein
VDYAPWRLQTVCNLFKSLGVEVVVVAPEGFDNTIFCCHLLYEIARHHLIVNVDGDIDDESVMSVLWTVSIWFVSFHDIHHPFRMLLQGLLSSKLWVDVS